MLTMDGGYVNRTVPYIINFSKEHVVDVGSDRGMYGFFLSFTKSHGSIAFTHFKQ